MLINKFSQFNTDRQYLSNDLPWGLQLTYPERLVLYFCLSNLLVKFVFELGMGIYWYLLSPKVFLFLICLITIDHLVWFFKAKRIGLPNDKPMLLVAALWVLMIVHGILVGLNFHESLTRFVIDLIPVMLAILSIVRFGLLSAGDLGRAFDRIKIIVFATATLNVLIGALAVQLGLPSKVSAGTIVFACMVALYFVTLAKMKIGPRFYLEGVVFFGVFIASISNVNRSTLASIGVLFVLALVMRLRFDIRGGLFGLALAAIFPLVLLAALPADSPTARRLQQTLNGGDAEESISLHSRVLEKEQVQASLERKGQDADFFGLGFGGTYEFNIYGEVILSHGHAHYGSAYLLLRYGDFSKVYLYAIGFSLILGFWIALKNGSNLALFAGALNAISFIYLFTYFYFFFFCMGLTYLVYAKNVRSKPVT